MDLYIYYKAEDRKLEGLKWIESDERNDQATKGVRWMPWH